MDAPAPVACVDLGTNAALMLVATQRHGHLEVLADESALPRLGQGVDVTGRLNEDARMRTLVMLQVYADKARALGARGMHLVGTSAMRDADNGAEFAREIEQATGFGVTIISGDTEAELTWEGLAPQLEGEGAAVALDIGGGSTEVMVGTRSGLQHRQSVNVGTVRLTERLLKHDPPLASEVAALRSALDQAFAGFQPSPGAPLWGLAGTVTTLACLVAGLPRHSPQQVIGMVLTAEQVAQWSERLALLSVAQRAALGPLEPRRADVVVASAFLLRHAMAALGASECHVADCGVRYGLAQRVLTGRWQTQPA